MIAGGKGGSKKVPHHLEAVYPKMTNPAQFTWDNMKEAQLGTLWGHKWSLVTPPIPNSKQGICRNKLEWKISRWMRCLRRWKVHGAAWTTTGSIFFVLERVENLALGEQLFLFFFLYFRLASRKKRVRHAVDDPVGCQPTFWSAATMDALPEQQVDKSKADVSVFGQRQKVYMSILAVCFVICAAAVALVLWNDVKPVNSK